MRRALTLMLLVIVVTLTVTLPSARADATTAYRETATARQTLRPQLGQSMVVRLEQTTLSSSPLPELSQASFADDICPDVVVVSEMCEGLVGFITGLIQAAIDLVATAVNSVLEQVLKIASGGAEQIVDWALTLSTGISFSDASSAPWIKRADEIANGKGQTYFNGALNKGVPIAQAASEGGKTQPFWRLYTRTYALAALLAIPILVIAGIQALIKQNIRELLQPLLMLPVVFIAAFAGIAVIDMLYRFSEGASLWLAGDLADDIKQLSNAIEAPIRVMNSTPAWGTLVGLGMTLITLVILIFVIFAAFAVWVVLLLRDGILILAAAFLPIGLVAAIWPVATKWLFRLVKLIMGLIIAKPVVIACLALAAALLSGPQNNPEVALSNLAPQTTTTVVGGGNFPGVLPGTPTTVVGGGTFSGQSSSSPTTVAPAQVAPRAYQLGAPGMQAVLTGAALPASPSAVTQLKSQAPGEADPGQTFRPLMIGAAIFTLTAFAPMAVVRIIGFAAEEVSETSGAEGLVKSYLTGQRYRVFKNQSGQNKLWSAPGSPYQVSGAIKSNIPIVGRFLVGSSTYRLHKGKNPEVYGSQKGRQAAQARRGRP